MYYTLTTIDFNENKSHNISVDCYPNTCPTCHKECEPRPLNIAVYDPYKKLEKNGDKISLQAIFQCPNKKCNAVFIAYYSQELINHPHTFTGNVEPADHLPKDFSENINNISPQFSVIYNQALKAENYGLDEVCGPGYRKSLEFLIKDYLISIKPDKKDKIIKSFLSPCIQEHVDDTKIKEIASRAVWLGNDQTHYTPKWENKDLNDLKSLINLTVHWIDMELEYSSTLATMPDGKT